MKQKDFSTVLESNNPLLSMSCIKWRLSSEKRLDILSIMVLIHQQHNKIGNATYTHEKYTLMLLIITF